MPLSALVEGNGTEAFIYTVDPDTSRAVRKPVRIDRIADEEAAVSAGLEGVERVVTDGAAYLADGTLIRIESAPKE